MHPYNLGVARLGERGEERMKTWLTVAEGAEYAGVSRDTIYTACERRELQHARVGGRRAIRLKPAWIDAWLERHTQGGETWPSTEHGSIHGGVS
jgi:excisionase family DNA binding protein